MSTSSTADDALAAMAIILGILALVTVIIVPTALWGQRKHSQQEYVKEEMIACIQSSRSADDCRILIYGTDN